MTVKFMIIDGQADFRNLLMHHVTTQWPDAVVSMYDPTSAGYLPVEFSGAGNDVILLGDSLGEREGFDVLRQFVARPGFPPVVYFGATGEEAAARSYGAAGFLQRERFRHRDLVAILENLLSARRRVASTGSLFLGDDKIGVHPLIRGYSLITKLHASANSSIYLAEREATAEQVVLKVLRHVPDVVDSVGAFDRFLQEYELIADIDHPNIVRIFDLGVGDDHAHIVMEYLDGGDLKSRIAAGMSAPEAVRFLQQMSSALAKTHDIGILHCDLKPGNIMLREDDTIALIDFGLAKRMRLRMELTDEGEIFGTPFYMSPEQGHGIDIDARSDIYSLGVIFYEMLTAEKPYSAESAMGIIYKHAHAPIPLLPPPVSAYQALLDRMLAKNPDDRLQSAAEVAQWL